MARKRHVEPSDYSWSLVDQGMELLTRAGLAGLHLSLSAAEKWRDEDPLAKALCDAAHWQLHDQAVRLECAHPPEESLKRLLEWAWQIRDQVYYLPGIHRGRRERENKMDRVQTHRGLVSTFVQQTGRQPPKLEPRALQVVALDAESPRDTVSIRYRPVVKDGIPRQLGEEFLDKVLPFTRRGKPRRVALPGYYFPGSAKRFDKAEEEWTGPASRAYLLLFAPIACVYTILHDEWAAIVPEIRSLDHFTRRLPDVFGQVQQRADRVQVAGLGDAGLRFAVAYAGRAVQKSTGAPRIYVIAMGVTDYYSSSARTRIRKNILDLRPSATAVARYGAMMQVLPNILVPFRRQDEDEDEDQVRGSHWVSVPCSRSRIADNLVQDRAWYADLQTPPPALLGWIQQQKKKRDENVSVEALWFQNLEYEGRRLMELAKKDVMWDSPEEGVFLDLFHRVLRRLLDKEQKALQRGGTRKLADRWEDRIDELRRGLARAKTLELNREFITAILAEAEWDFELAKQKQVVWNVLNHPHEWKKARDLAVLALVTFTDGRLAAGGRGNNDKAEGEDQ